MKILPAWPLMFYQFQWDDINTHLQDLIDVCRTEEVNKSTSNVATTIKHNLYESNFDFFKINHSAIQALASWCNKSVFEAASHANQGIWAAGENYGINIHESWCHITRNGGYHDMHRHPMSSWSGILYLDPGNTDLLSRNGVNRFYKPWETQYTDPGTAWAKADSIDLAGAPGTLTIFPSWIPHSAMPYYGDKERVVVAFNSQVIS